MKQIRIKMVKIYLYLTRCEGVFEEEEEKCQKVENFNEEDDILRCDTLIEVL